MQKLSPGNSAISFSHYILSTLSHLLSVLSSWLIAFSSLVADRASVWKGKVFFFLFHLTDVHVCMSNQSKMTLFFKFTICLKFVLSGKCTMCSCLQLLMISCAVLRSFPQHSVYFIMTLIALDVFKACLKARIKHISRTKHTISIRSYLTK